MTIEYIVGDATVPRASGLKIIVHCCNSIGAWGAGFVMALSRKWDAPERQYRSWFLEHDLPQMGDVQFVPVGNKIIVANLIGQKGVKGPGNETPVSYDAIRKGMETVAKHAKKHHASVHMPRLGCGLAGGSWDRIEPILEDTLDELMVRVYDLPTGE